MNDKKFSDRSRWNLRRRQSSGGIAVLLRQYGYYCEIGELCRRDVLFAGSSRCGQTDTADMIFLVISGHLGAVKLDKK